METSRKVSTFWCGKAMISGVDGIRTPDPLLAKPLRNPPPILPRQGYGKEQRIVLVYKTSPLQLYQSDLTPET
jgi:hypothetical protein